MDKTFRVASPGTMALVWTFGFIFILAFYVVLVVVPVLNGTAPSTVDVGLAVLLAVLIAYAWVRSVRRYRLTADKLVIERAGPGRVHISLDNIESAEFNPDLGSFYNIRPLGLGGLFGWAGEARVRKPTDVHSLEATVYGTNPGKSVLLRMKSGRPIILTPDDPQALVNSIREATGMVRAQARFSGKQPSSSARRGKKPASRSKK